MKNLKKVLALGLALVMILGMFTMASAAETKKVAADFTDWDKVEHKDAVALCVDLGIINGLPDGSFAPDQTIDRASWAKLVYFTATGDDNADAYLGANAGLQDIKGNWAESYINYLVANKYVSGDNVGNYNPTGAVTVAAGLKTMLTVLGYDAEDRGYQNDNAWMGNIITDAKRNGLMDDVDRSQTAPVNLTRENAAQIVYNTLQAETVEAVKGRDNGEKYVTTYTKTGSTLGLDVFSAKPVTVNVTVDSEGKVVLNPVDAPVGLNAKDLEDVSASSTLAGESAVVWVKVKGTGAFDSVVSTAVAKAASSATKTFTDGVTIANITNEEAAKAADDEAHFVAAAADDMKVYVDGAAKSVTEAKRGDVVEVYTSGDKVSTIKITTWTVGQLNKDAETRTSGGKLQVRLPGVSGLSQWKDADTVEGYQGLADGDVILFNKDAQGNYLIEKAAVVNGKVTEAGGKTDVKLTMNGKAYQVSKIAGVPTSGDNAPDFDNWDVKGNKDNEYDFYLDKNGTVCFVVLVEGEVAKDVAYVLDAAYITGSGIKGSYYAEAELLFTDGTTQIVKVAKVGDTDMDKDAKDSGEATMAALVGKFIEYSVSDNAYTVETKDTTTVIGGEDDLKDIQSQITFIKDDATASANAKTVFIVKKGDNYEIFTGFENVPAMKATGAYVAESGKAATYVYLETDSYDGEAPEAWVYIADEEAYTTNSSNLKVYEVYEADGTKTKMPVHKDSTISAAGFYSVDKVNENDGNSLTAIGAFADELKTMAEGVLEIGSEKVPYDKSTVGVVVDIDKDGKFVSVGSFDPNSFTIEDSTTYTYTAKQDGGKADSAADFIYVIRTEVGAAD